MSEEKIKMVPAICTRCGGAVEVDPSKEMAVCPYCGTQFIIEKAVNNYNVQRASIEHADNVNIDLKGSVKEVLDFVGDNVLESKEERIERRKQEAENQRMVTAGFFRIFGVMMAVMMLFGIGCFIFLNATGGFEEEDGMSSGFAEAGELQCEVTDGCLFIDVTGQEDVLWAYQEFDSVRTKLSSEENDIDEYHSTIVADVEDGIGFAVTACFDEDMVYDTEPTCYSVVKVRIEDWNIVEAMESVIVDDLGDYGFEQ